jgi:hypothetical protein
MGMPVRNNKFGLSRRTLLKAGAAISILPAPRVFAQSAEPLKIGFLTVLTGPLAAGGKQQEEGAALFLKERNGMIAGRKVERSGRSPPTKRWRWTATCAIPKCR